MAVYAKIDPAKPVNYARVTIQPTPGDTGPCMLLTATPVVYDMDAQEDVLDTRYKVGGSTTWERPAASGA